MRDAARRDVLAQYVHLAESAGEETANRFLDRVEQTVADLLDQPKIGTPLESRRPEFNSLRKWRIRGFEDVLVFYLDRQGGIAVIRVLGAAMDWRHRLDID